MEDVFLAIVGVQDPLPKSHGAIFEARFSEALFDVAAVTGRQEDFVLVLKGGDQDAWSQTLRSAPIFEERYTDCHGKQRFSHYPLRVEVVKLESLLVPTAGPMPPGLEVYVDLLVDSKEGRAREEALINLANEPGITLVYGAVVSGEARVVARAVAEGMSVRELTRRLAALPRVMKPGTLLILDHESARQPRANPPKEVRKATILEKVPYGPTVKLAKLCNESDNPKLLRKDVDELVRAGLLLACRDVGGVLLHRRGSGGCPACARGTGDVPPTRP